MKPSNPTREYRGLPPNYNPFLVVTNHACDNSTLADAEPKYFYFRSSADLPMARCQVETPLLSQEMAETLVRKVATGNPRRNFAVKEECSHIIPGDLRRVVQVIRVRVDMYFDGECGQECDCYYLD